jgi:ketosteroid isomerase-like protein
VTKQDVDRWLEAYVEAWKTYDRERIEALFAEDVSYRYHPSDEPIEGRCREFIEWFMQRTSA